MPFKPDPLFKLAIVGLDEHVTFSPHPAAARIRGVTMSTGPAVESNGQH
jgi:hypothetical protein